jgi:hypothetical protein
MLSAVVGAITTVVHYVLVRLTYSHKLVVERSARVHFGSGHGSDLENVLPLRKGSRVHINVLVPSYHLILSNSSNRYLSPLCGSCPMHLELVGESLVYI